MPVPDRRRERYSACGTVTKVLVVVIVMAIATVTLVWLLSGVRSGTESSDGTGNGIRVATNSTETDHPAGAPRLRDRPTLPAPDRSSTDQSRTDRPATDRLSSDRSPADRPAMVARLSAAGWSPSAAVAVGVDRRHTIGPPRHPEGRTPWLALRDRATKRNDHYWFSASDDRDDDGDMAGSTTRTDDPGTQTWQNVEPGPTNHYSTTGTADHWNDGSSGYHDPYDLTADDYNYINNINKQLTDEPFGGGGGGGGGGENGLGPRDPVMGSESHYSTVHGATGSASEYRPQATRSQPPPSVTYPPGVDRYPPGTAYRPPGAGYYPPGGAMSYVPPPPRTTTAVAPQYPPGDAMGPQPKVVAVAPGKAAAVDWRTVAVLALVKLALVKLKAFAVVNALVFLLVGAKVLLVAVSLKSVLLLKSAKLVKALALPLMLLPLLTAVVASLFPLGRALQAMMAAAPNNAATGFPGFPGALQTTVRPIVVPSQSSSSGALTPGRPAGGSSAFLPGVPSRFPGQPAVPANTSLRPQSAFKLLNDLDGRQHRPQPLETYHDPASDVFRNLLNTENCVERIACRLAVAEKAGIFPPWINRVLSGVSNVISSEKLKLYFKAYNDVNNNVLTNSTDPDSWATWCLERYDCNL